MNNLNTNTQQNTKYYYSKSTLGFYIDNINTYIPDDCIEITKEQHNELLIAINSGCIIFDDLTYSMPKPSPFHLLVNNHWVEDIEKKRKYTISQNEIIKQTLLENVNQHVSILQDIIDFNMQENNEDEQLKNWKKYRVLLTKIDTSIEHVEFPKKPICSFSL